MIAAAIYNNRWKAMDDQLWARVTNNDWNHTVEMKNDLIKDFKALLWFSSALDLLEVHTL